MYNFLFLVFSLSILITFEQDSTSQKYYTPQGAQGQSKSSQTLVPPSQGIDCLRQNRPYKDSENPGPTSQQRFTSDFSYQSSNGYDLFRRCQSGVLPMEMCLWAHQQEMACRMRSAMHRGLKAQGIQRSQRTRIGTTGTDGKIGGRIVLVQQVVPPAGTILVLPTKHKDLFLSCL